MKTLLHGGTLIRSDGEQRGDLLMEDGRITAVGSGIPSAGCAAYDATGCLIFPGFLDAHTHLEMDTGTTRTADDFESGTAAALAGGTTSILDFATQDSGGSLAQALACWHQKADGRASCDYGFHLAITDWNDRVKVELPEVLADGVTSFKLYMAYENLRVSDKTIYEVLRAVRALGGVVGAHCENGDLIDALIAERRAAGELSPQVHPLCRPDLLEAEAIGRYLTIARLADTPVLIVHLSSADGLAVIRAARARGQRVYVESCPQYLLLDRALYDAPDFEGAKVVCSPPLRTKADRDALWEAVENGEIDTLSTDHCSFNFAGQKELGRADFTRIPNGLPGVEHRPMLFYTAGVASGRVSAVAMAQLLAERPARLYGLYPRKGTLDVGADADIVVWDPAYRGTISAARQLQRVDYTPYEGMAVVGCARAVFLRGILAAENGEIRCRGAGRYLRRGLGGLE